AASEAEPAPSDEAPATQRTILNLLGEVDSSSGESRRNENMQITLVDNNVLQELNIRMGPTATVVSEFDIDKTYFGAEFGGSPGAQIHISRKKSSGIHGNLHAAHNNSIFTARSFFQVGEVQPARENDYGFDLGLPVWKGGRFSVDGSQGRIRGSVNGNVLVPTPEERTPLATDPALRRIVSRILDSYPDVAPNRTDINPRALNTNAPQTIDNEAIGARFDQSLGDLDNLSLRHRFTSQHVDAFQLVKGQNPNTTTRSHESRISWTRTWSATTVTEASVGFDRVTSLIVPDETALGPLIWSGRQLQTLGGSSSLPLDRARNRFRYAGLLRHVRGRHFFTAGFELARGQLNGTESSRHSGLFSFSSNFTDELGNQRDTITNLRLGTPSNFILGVGNTHRGFRDGRTQAFLGDHWSVNRRLTLDYGIRYEPAMRPIEVNGFS
ncbi:MAG: hypothetical protein GY953_33655, partial [bacterium]|nr:hypothetical protein [bacterium]